MHIVSELTLNPFTVTKATMTVLHTNKKGLMKRYTHATSFNQTTSDFMFPTFQTPSKLKKQKMELFFFFSLSSLT